MSIQQTHTTEGKIEMLSYPNIAMQFVEAVVGSSRREALGIIRDARLEDWSIKTDPSPSIRIASLDGEVVFQFGRGLEAVHLSCKGGARHIAGSCEMAQRLLRFAGRAFEVVTARLERQCLQALANLADGKRESGIQSCQYDSRYRNEHFSDGGSDRGTIRRGEITTSYGVVSLKSEERFYYLGNHFYSRQPIYEPPDYFGGDHCQGWSGAKRFNLLGGIAEEGKPLSSWRRPPCGEIDVAEASFANQKLSAIHQMLGLPESDSEISKLSKTQVRALLEWARINARVDSSTTKSSC